MTLRRLAVFLGSSPGTDPALVDLARRTGDVLAGRGIGVVYGGGGSGLMGALADGALSADGEVVGVIPGFMVEREWGRDDLTELHVVETMHERKALMAEHADAFLALPGGLGTLEEIFEAWTWRQIGVSGKPVGFLDAGGFWAPLRASLEALVAAGFVRAGTLEDVVWSGDLDDAVDCLSALCRRPGTWDPHRV